MLRRRAVSVLAVLVVGCGGRYGGAPERPRSAKPGIEAAALPYQVVDARSGKSVDEPAFWTRLAGARAVCVGEEHPNPHHHWLQLHVVRELIRRLPKGARLALAMEMFQRPFQGVLDDYAAHRIDAAQLRSRSGYEERWGYEYGFYGPTIDAAVGAGAQLLAANAAKELTKKVSHHGVESLTADEKTQLPELRLDDTAHRAWFDSLMEEMGGSAAHSNAKAQTKTTDEPSPHGDATADDMPTADRVYSVQVIWDETMADTAARWLAANPRGHVVLLAGNGHCHDSAIVNRLKRRGVGDALSIRGVVDDGEGNVAEALAKPINDYVVVLQMSGSSAARGGTPEARSARNSEARDARNEISPDVRRAEREKD
jgi:uncharacterized iron-regulated protein